MKNPWENFSLDIYEKHMQLPEVMQLQTLKRIMGSQFAYAVSTAAVFGVAGGNGLEHIEKTNIEKVYGIDINKEYLSACKKRFAYLGERLELLDIDLADLSVRLPSVQLVIANLIIEYFGIDSFLRRISSVNPEYVSCVIQKNAEAGFVSESPYKNAFQNISELHRDIREDTLTAGMTGINYVLILKESYSLPNGKLFIRLDYKRT